MKEEKTQKLLTTPIFDDKLDTSLDSIGRDDTMTSKFYNFQCIILYGYIEYAVAQQLVQLNQSVQHLINTPLELYETPYMAKLLTPKSGKRQLIAFAVYVQDSIFDELDLELENHIKASDKPVNQIKEEVSVIRNLKKYKTTKSKMKPYISYTIQNQNAIKNIFPA